VTKRIQDRYVTTDNTNLPFDESAALEALERLQQEIQEARLRRERKVEEFDAWLRATRSASHAERLAALEGGSQKEPAVPAAARGAHRATDAASLASASTARPAVVPADWGAEDTGETTVRSRALSDLLGDRRVHYATAAAAVVALVIAVWMGSGGSTAPPPTSASGAAPPPQESAAGEPTQPVAPAPAAASAPAAAATRPLEIELTTSRLVWIRVTADGERVLEREVPADRRLTFGADRVIVIRAGNGGSVSLRVNGEDQGSLGRDGQIAVRTLTPR